MPDVWRKAVRWRGREDEDQEDGGCCITSEDGGRQKTHLVEKTERQWWIQNNIMDHSSTSALTKVTEAIGQEIIVPGSLISLNDRLRQIWDSNLFGLFPLELSNGIWRLHYVFL